MVSNNKKQISFLSEGLLLALLTSVIYWITFSYESAFLATYGIPAEHVRLELETIFLVILSISGLIWGFFSIGNLLSIHWPQHPSVQEKVLRLIFIFIVLVAPMYGTGFNKNSAGWYLVAIIFIFAFELLWPVLIFHDTKGFKNKIIADEESESPIRERTIFGRLFKLVGHFAYVLILVGYFGGKLSIYIAQGNALRKINYSVLKSKPGYAIVRSYSDRTIAVSFDETAKKITNDFIILPLEAYQAITFSQKEIGPLVKTKEIKKKGK